jgi:signal transduction histidine kinase
MTSTSTPRTLDLIVVEDSEDDYLLLMAHLSGAGWKVNAQRVETAEALEAALAQGGTMAVISDHQLPRFGSMQALRIVRAFDANMPFVLVSGAMGEEVAVAAMQAGADDFVMKDRLARLSPGLTRALEAAATRRQRQEAEAALVVSQTELRDLASHLARVREEEREAIGREIHDDVGSTLMAVKFNVAWLKGQLKHDAPAVAKLAELDRLVDAAILSSTRIMHDLRPGILDAGIVAALEWQARDFQQRLGITCGFFASAESITVDRPTSIAMFRICQEALNNVAKYAAARRVDVRLDGRGNRLRMTIHDDGKGIDALDIAKPDCYGLRGMRERALSLGGVVEITGNPGRGTTVALALPFVATAGDTIGER